MRESTARFSLSHIYLSKLVNLLTSALFFHALHIVILGLLLLSPLVALLSPLKIANRSYNHSAPALWNNLPSTSCCSPRHSFFYVKLACSPVSDLSTSPFLNKLKTYLFILPFLLCMYSPRLSQD